MFASNCNPCQIGYLPDFPTLKALGSAPDCFKERKIKQTSNLKTIGSAPDCVEERKIKQTSYLKTIGSAPDCFKERNKNYEIKIFWKIFKLLLRKSPWPAWGQKCPILAKVGSATDLGQPLLHFVNRMGAIQMLVKVALSPWPGWGIFAPMLAKVISLTAAWIFFKKILIS